MRLIDADALPKEISWDKIENTAFWETINEQPTIDAEPVKHAHWIPDERETGEGSNTYKCSACGEIQMLIEGTPNENGWKYCPHCGAKMVEYPESGEEDRL